MREMNETKRNTLGPGSGPRANFEGPGLGLGLFSTPPDGSLSNIESIPFIADSIVFIVHAAFVY